MTQVIQNVSDTAFMVAGFRAAENERPNPLFRDPLAARLAGEHGGEHSRNHAVQRSSARGPW